MAKKKRSPSRASKETREADAFIQTSDKLIQWFQEQQAAIVIGLVVITFGLAVYGVLSWLNDEREMAGQVAYFAAEKSYLDLKEKRDRAENDFEEAQKDKKKEAVKGKDFPSGDVDKDYGSALGELRAVKTEHRSTKAALLAALQISQIYLDHEKVDLASQELSSVEDSAPENGLIKGLWSFQRGIVAEKQGNCELAIEHWNQVALNRTADFLQPNALLKQGVCHQVSRNFPKARELFNRVIAEFGDTTAGQSARAYLRIMDSSPQDG